MSPDARASASSGDLDRYMDAFAQYLHTGNGAALAAYCDPQRLAALAVYRNGYYRACSDALRPCSTHAASSHILDPSSLGTTCQSTARFHRVS